MSETQEAEKWRQAGLKSWATRRAKAQQSPPPAADARPSNPDHSEGTDWRPISFEDIPTREELAALSIDMLRNGITNSDRMRDTIRRHRKLILQSATGNWNESPSDKFVNEHAWALKYLIDQESIEAVAPKEYRLLTRF